MTTNHFSRQSLSLACPNCSRDDRHLSDLSQRTQTPLGTKATGEKYVHAARRRGRALAIVTRRSPMPTPTVCVEWIGRRGHPASYTVAGGVVAGPMDVAGRELRSPVLVGRLVRWLVQMMEGPKTAAVVSIGRLPRPRIAATGRPCCPCYRVQSGMDCCSKRAPLR